VCVGDEVGGGVAVWGVDAGVMTAAGLWGGGGVVRRVCKVWVRVVGVGEAGGTAGGPSVGRGSGAGQ
jgi:hypothetical protein